MRSLTAKIQTSRIPIQNTGTAMPSCEITEMIEPYQLFWRTTDRMPSGTAIMIASTKAINVSGSVTIRRLPISVSTGAPLTNELPRWKRTREPIN